MLKIIAIGNLTNDIELKTNSTTGKPYALLRIASDRRYRDKDGNRLTDFISVKVRGSLLPRLPPGRRLCPVPGPKLAVGQGMLSHRRHHRVAVFLRGVAALAGHVLRAAVGGNGALRLPLDRLGRGCCGFRFRHGRLAAAAIHGTQQQTHRQQQAQTPFPHGYPFLSIQFPAGILPGPARQDIL